MIDFKLEWRRFKPSGPFQSEQNWLFVGGWALASYNHDGCAPKDSPAKIAIHTELPLNGKVFKRFWAETEDQAKAICEKRVRDWLKTLSAQVDA